MLDRAGNSDRDIKLGGDHFAGLANLPIVGRITGINRRTRCTNSAAQFIGQFFDQLEIIFGAQTATTRNNHTRTCQLGAVALGNLVFNPLRQAGICNRRNALHRSRAAIARRIKAGGADGQNLFIIRGFHRLNGIARVNRTGKCITVNYCGHIRDHHHIQQRRNPRHHVFRPRSCRRNNVVVIWRQRHNQIGKRFGQIMAIGGVIDA